ncbi:MAG TPA: trigger factor [Candidatus Limnocylindrales bacterium]|jgi:trigger factor
MNVTATPGPRSSVKLDIELPAERLTRAVDASVRHLSRRTKVPGFRPGKAPRFMLDRVLGPGAVLEDAVDHLVQDAYRDALVEKAILPLDQAKIEVEQAEEGKPLVFSATLHVRPEVELGDYRHFNFQPEIEEITDATVDRVVDELRDQNATLAPVEDRAAKKGDYAVIGYTGSRDGTAFPGGSAERMPLILGEERLIPGFEDHITGLRAGERTEFDVTFPDDYAEAELAGKQAHFEAELKELREKILPALNDEFAASMGDYADLAALRVDVRRRLERNALDRARHGFSDRIIEYAVANSTMELPDILIDQEIEVMHDEFRATLARQRISQDAYLKATNQSEDDLHKEFRPRAEQRVKVLLVLSKIAEVEGIMVTDDAVDAEVERARQRYAGDARLIGYFESERGRNFIRSTLRRSKVVEYLVDGWLVEHPDHPALPHIEDDATSTVEAVAESAGSAEVPADTGSATDDAEAVTPA